MFKFCKIKQYLLNQDIYGHKIGVHFQGKPSYNTWIGLICTCLFYGVVLQSAIMMSRDFMSDSRQDEKVNIEKFDRHRSEPYNLADNGVNFYIIPFRDYDNGEDNEF